MKRVYNFSAGPAVLPEEVLREAADEMLDYKGCGKTTTVTRKVTVDTWNVRYGDESSLESFC